MKTKIKLGYAFLKIDLNSKQKNFYNSTEVKRYLDMA